MSPTQSFEGFRKMVSYKETREIMQINREVNAFSVGTNFSEIVNEFFAKSEIFK